MRTATRAAIPTALFMAIVAVVAQTAKMDFEKDDLGKAPAGFSFALTGQGKQNVKVPTNVWHTIRVEATGDHFVVTYDGNKVLDAKDHTFKDAGKVGLWTKADSVMAFDGLTIGGR